MDNCEQWQGRINEYGYGTVGVKLAHRAAYEKVHGPIPDGMTIDHVCHNPETCQLGKKCPHRSCVNVAHMVLTTPEENRKRSYNAGGIKTHCPNGHPYEGNNLLVSSGRRLCRTCRTAQLKKRRYAASVKRCETKGHTRDEQTGQDGRVYCAVCASERGKASLKNRNRTNKGVLV